MPPKPDGELIIVPHHESLHQGSGIYITHEDDDDKNNNLEDQDSDGALYLEP